MSPEKAETFGERLRRVREERGIVLRELAEQAGLTDSYLSEVERGLRPPPRRDRAAIARLAEALEDDPYTLYLLAGAIPPEMEAALLALDPGALRDVHEIAEEK